MNFKSWRSYWDFKYSVDNKQRYILDKESNYFLNSIVDTCGDRERFLKKGSIFWRAQNGHDWRTYYQNDPNTGEDIHIDDIPIPFPKDRMKPLVDSAAEGRANSKGIPCLYVATDKETAMSEVRPWLGAILSVAQLRLTRDLRVLDFSVEQGKDNFHIYFQEPTQEKITKAVWSDIDNAFSQPTKASDLKSEYAPTQIISEFIKSKGYDGIAYKSALAEGHNICLFDLKSADIINCSIYEPIKINFDFKKVEDFNN
ncbi:RES family NAD+ phosphorylase [Pectobacterium polonicum]|uniref:RES family NAD+ phosphorylase n=1 Tax=Pectobacterium polonicum TaxID=2485124 RepID=A0AAE9NRQ7_9GAMM|nr:RES family NAD+ phosphorylase [Pectobacterium polonicum]UVO08696.1 RES family NAD+ phosphorylase [Pectobacterium polonicum]